MSITYKSLFNESNANLIDAEIDNLTINESLDCTGAQVILTGANITNISGVVLSGDIVGTTGIQTLTNKTIDANNNTISNLLHGVQVDNPSISHGTTSNIVGKDDVQTLTNKTLTSNTNVVQISDSNFRVYDNTDNTKVVALECSSITTGNTRTLTIPDNSGTIALITDLVDEFDDSLFRVFDNGDNTKKVALQCSSITTGTTRTLTVQNSDGTIAYLSDIPSATTDFDDSTFRVSDNSDNTKKVALECSGITTGTTRTLTVPNSSGTIALLTDINYPTTFQDSTFEIYDNGDNTKIGKFQASAIPNSTTRTYDLPNISGELVLQFGTDSTVASTTDPWASHQSANYNLRLIVANNSKSVVFTIGQNIHAGSITGSTSVSYSGLLPSDYRPQWDTTFTYCAIVSGVNTTALMIARSSTGTIDFYANVGGGAFPGSASLNQGHNSCSFSWCV